MSPGSAGVGHRGAIAERPDVLVALDAEGLVDPDTPTVVERQPEVVQQRRGLHTGRPDQGAGGHDGPVGEDGGFAVVGRQRLADVDLDSAALEPARGVRPQAPWDLGQDRRSRIDEHPPLGCVAQARVVAQGRPREIVELRERLDSRVAGSHEDEAELRGRAARRGSLQPLEDVVAEGNRIGEIFEAAAVLDEP